MLDLDELAERRAEALCQSGQQWKEMLWSRSFQKLSANMSDGEVENLLICCASTKQLETVMTFLAEHPQMSLCSPFEILVKEAQKSKLGMSDWIRKLDSN
jgi:hypothetical protein